MAPCLPGGTAELLHLRRCTSPLCATVPTMLQVRPLHIDFELRRPCSGFPAAAIHKDDGRPVPTAVAELEATAPPPQKKEGRRIRSSTSPSRQGTKLAPASVVRARGLRLRLCASSA
jgi:hypothetical protein